MRKLYKSFSSLGFLPHGQSYNWDSKILWLQNASDFLIGTAYYSVPVALICLVWKRRDLIFNNMFLVFTLSLFAAGTTHFFQVVTTFRPFYYAEGIVKFITAILSILAAVFVWPLVHKFLLLPSHEQMERKNLELKDLNQSLEEKVRERSKDSLRLASIVNSSGDAILSTDLDGIVTHWNPAAEKLYGFSKEEIFGSSMSLIIPQSRLEEYANLVEKVEFGQTVTLETVREKKSGESFYISLTLSPIFSQTGDIVGISSISRDITENKIVQEKLAKSERLLKTTVENVPAGILSVDSSGQITFVNKALEEMFGYGKGELLGRVVEDLVPIDFRERHPEYRKLFWRNPKSRQMGVGRELNGIKKDGSEFPLEIGLTPVTLEKNEALASVIDISERKKAERLISKEHKTIRKVLELNTDGWWDWDLTNPDDEFLSPSFKKLFGYEDHELPNKRETWKQLIFPEDLKVAEKNFRKHIESSGQHPYYQKARFKHKNGSTVWVISKGVAFKGESGKYERLIGVQFDITNEIQLDQELRASNNELKLKNEEMEQFVYTISHDLKSPLVTALSFLSFLKEDLLEGKKDDVNDSIDELEKSLNQMRVLIHDILEVSRIGKVEVSLETVELNEVVKSILSNNDLVSDGNLDIVVEGDLGIVVGDKKRLTTLFENLILNAKKYANLGQNDKGVIVISGKSVDTFQVISVSDNGPGIEEKYHKKIFELFFRLEKNVEGTGVGLALVSKIAAQHNGEVWVESIKDHGSNFHVKLPRKLDKLSKGGSNFV